ncbi:MAG TPA: glycosyltransferase, partial [Burkholderiales bacterium]|nr:glycosyltransferase [Burkholderiales bacterium]
YPLGSEFDFRPRFFADRLAGVFKVLVLGDDEHYFEVAHRYYGQCFDLVLTSNPLHERYRLYGIDSELVPGVYNGLVFAPAPGTPKTIDVSFVGAMQGKVGRAEYAAALRDAGFNFQAYGQGSAAGFVERSEAIDVYRRSRVNLNFTGGSAVTPLDAHLGINRRIRGVKGRCQMIALCGSFVLSEYAPGIEQLFDIGAEIDVFHDKAELVEKLRFYLANEKRREAMAAKAHARAREQYDEREFGRRLARSLESRAQAKRSAAPLPVYIDAVFWRGFGAWRFKYLVIFLLSGRLALLLGELGLLLRTGRCSWRAALWCIGLGLHVQARTSRVAAALAGVGRGLRRMLRPAS